MERDLHILGEALLEARFDIAKKMYDTRAARGMQNPDGLDEHAVTKIRADFVARFGEALLEGADVKKIHKELEEWGQEVGQLIYSMGITLEDALKDTTYYRSFIYDVIEQVTFARQVPIKSVFASAKVIDPLLDHAVYCFSLTYIHHYQKNLDHAKTALLELSVPVVPVSNGIAVLPLIGHIDTERAWLLMEETLKSAKKLSLTHLILDLSGVLVVDTMVADQIFKVTGALKLLGVETTITGIRPEIAQTAISLGLDFSRMQTRATLQQALAEILPFPS